MGWLEKLEIKLSQLKMLVEVEVGVELGKSVNIPTAIWTLSSNHKNKSMVYVKISIPAIAFADLECFVVLLLLVFLLLRILIN